MLVSSTLKAANDDGLNEHTPLLKEHRPEQVPNSVDEEAQHLASVDKSSVQDAPRDIGGVISILLLGMNLSSKVTVNF